MASKYPQTLFKVVLVEPEIPQNTGNIGRTCVGSWSQLHLVGQLGFELTDRQVKRAGLDYWPELELYRHTTWDEWLSRVPDQKRVFFFSTKGKTPYHDVQFQPGDWFVFGKETKGLSPEILQKYPEQVVTIPFPGQIRSFNLSNAVAMALGEGLRQMRAAGLLPSE